MIFIFDFDRTLLDTEKFKKELCKIFDLSAKEYDSHIDEFFRKTGKHYSPENHVKLLKKLKKIKSFSEEKKVLINYKKILKTFDTILFPEAKNILDLIKRRGDYMILITQGIPASQKRKVEGAGLKKYFSKIIYTPKKKAENKFVLNLAKSNQKILLINDKPTEALEMQKAIGKSAEIFLVNSPHARRDKHNLKINKNIGGLKKYIVPPQRDPARGGKKLNFSQNLIR